MGRVGYPDATRVNSLLSQICAERGWCLPPGSDELVRSTVADGDAAVVDMLIRTELEIDPVMCDAATRRWLTGKVNDWLFDPNGRGASSGLPI
jgi:hypothetical protein